MKDIMKKKELIIGVIVIVVIILLLVFFILNKGSDSSNTTNKANTSTDDVVITEKDIENAYGFSGDDAIKLVKTSFDSDAFTYTATVTGDSKYLVTCKSKIDETVLKFEVDPVTKSFYEV